jgi:rhodanese-related sulfurtransferase
VRAFFFLFIFFRVDQTLLPKIQKRHTLMGVSVLRDACAGAQGHHGIEAGQNPGRSTENRIWDLSSALLHPFVSRLLYTFRSKSLSLIGLIDVPLHEIVANPGDYVFPELGTYVVCRLGNDSQIAADALRSARPDPGFVVKDLVGGLRAWSREVDPEFPVY